MSRAGWWETEKASSGLQCQDETCWCLGLRRWALWSNTLIPSGSCMKEESEKVWWTGPSVQICSGHFTVICNFWLKFPYVEKHSSWSSYVVRRELDNRPDFLQSCWKPLLHVCSWEEYGQTLLKPALLTFTKCYRRVFQAPKESSSYFNFVSSCVIGVARVSFKYIVYP